MGVEHVRDFFKENGYNYEIIEFDESTATVDLAAKALGVDPALIAKTMALRLKDRDIIIVSKGDARIDNKKYKTVFNTKFKMMKLGEVLEKTGHPVGGVCPFGLKNPMDIYLDESLKSFEYVYPAAGSMNSAVKITPKELEKVTCGKWINVCK